MPAHPPTAAEDALRLLTLNQLLLLQALQLAAAHGGPGRPVYAGPTGSHLRHVVEHYEALLFPAELGVVDYDARPRDPALETDPHLAQRRLRAVHEALGQGAQALVDTPLRQRGLGGLAGESSFVVATSMGRELVFLASHTVHHFALLAGHCRQQGIPTPEGFGVAPATRAHARASRSPAYA